MREAIARPKDAERHRAAIGAEQFGNFIVVAKDGAGLGVHEKNFAGAEAIAFDDLFIAEIGEADFGADDEQAVAGENVTHGAKAVAVEFCADHLAVAEDQSGGTVPGFLLRAAFSR